MLPEALVILMFDFLFCKLQVYQKHLGVWHLVKEECGETTDIGVQSQNFSSGSHKLVNNRVIKWTCYSEQWDMYLPRLLIA